MKKYLILLFMLVPMLSWAQDLVEIDGIWYNIIEKGKVAEVTSPPLGTEYSGNITIPELVVYNGVTYSVTSIGRSAFLGCYSLTSVSIPNSVTTIGKYAFKDCSGLTSIDIPNFVTSIEEKTFYGCKRLTSIDIPNSLTSIGESAFSDCKGLTSIIIPNSVTSIGNQAFDGCINLTSITIGNSVTSIGDRAFLGCGSLTSVSIPNSVTRIGEYAFQGSGLTSIDIPNSVTSIGICAFMRCSHLTSITIPNSVTYIDRYTFDFCSALTSVTIPNSVTSIGEGAFEDCSSLTEITIVGVPYIRSNAFASCKNIETVTCLANNIIGAHNTAFYDSYTEYATLRVPEPTVAVYSSQEPWKNFGKIESINGGSVEKCATPVINFANGQITATSATQGAVCHIDYKTNGTGSASNTLSVAASITVTAYATADGYAQSETATVTFDLAQLGGNDNQAALEALQKDLEDANGENASLRDQIGTKEAEVKSLKDELSTIKASLEELKDTNDALKQSNALLAESNERQNAELAENAETIASLKAENATLSDELSLYCLGDMNKDGKTDLEDVVMLLTMDSYSGDADALAQLAEETSITLTQIDERYGDVEYYKLNGVKVDKPIQPGIYLVKKDGQTKMIVVKK